MFIALQGWASAAARGCPLRLVAQTRQRQLTCEGLQHRGFASALHAHDDDSGQLLLNQDIGLGPHLQEAADVVVYSVELSQVAGPARVLTCRDIACRRCYLREVGRAEGAAS